MKRFRHDEGLTVTDLFCGAGGESTGLVEAGLDVKFAANHWKTAIESHAANHPGTEHAQANINHMDMRCIPRTRILWASVICTEISPAGGRRRTRNRDQLALLEEGPIDDAAFEKTRATALDVIRATEVHKYDIICVENVPEFATDWSLFDWWRNGMHLLGYRSRVVSVSSAHVGGPGNPLAPQWRDRIFIVFARHGVPMPDLDLRPLAPCVSCGVDVEAQQAWNPGRDIGAYREQYRYVCPNTACGHATVEPYIRPASEAIDWTDVGTPIRDRKLREFFTDKTRTVSLGFHHLAPKTMAKIVDGYRTYLTEPSLIAVNHGGDSRAIPVRRAPLPTRCTKVGDGLIVPGSFIAELRGGGSTHRPVTHPLATMAANGNHHGLVLPYRRGCAAYRTDRPLHTMSTVDSGALVQADPLPEDVLDLNFRMLQPHEQLAAQRFPDGYVVYGNKGERTIQAGNAVSVNAAHWIGQQIKLALAS